MGAVWKLPQVARGYLAGTRGAVPLAAEQIDMMLRLIAASNGVERFLDLGCGDGVLAAAILESYPQASGLLVDFSATMLDAARERFGGARVAFAETDYGDAAWLDVAREAGPYDAIVSGFSIHHQADGRKRELYAEIFELLSPGGAFVNIEHVQSASGWGETLWDEFIADALYQFERQRGGGRSRDEVAADYASRPDKAANILAPVETQCAWLRGIGFTDVDCYLKILELAVFGGRRPG